MELNEVRVNLGGFVDDGEAIDWTLFESNHEKIALIGNDSKAKRIATSIEKQIKGMEGVSYFKINASEDPILENEGTLSVITNYEKTEPSDSIKNHFLLEHRRDFVDMFIKLMERHIGLVRKELSVSYRPTLEGPLIGYIRAMQKVEGEVRTEFDTQIESLDNLTWENEGDLFSYKTKGNTIDEKFLSLFKGIWSFWVFAMITPINVPKVVHFDIPDTSEYDEEQLVFLKGLIKILEQISNLGHIPLLITTDRVSHINESSIRYKLITKNSGKDYDFTGSSIGFDDQGESFVLIDDVDRNKYVGKIIS